MNIQILVYLFVVKYVTARGPSLGDENLNGSVLFSLSGANFRSAFVAFIPADPDLHSIDGEGYLRYRNATISVSSSGSMAGLAASFEDAKLWYSDTSSLLENEFVPGRIRVLRQNMRNIFDGAYDSVTKMLYWSQRIYKKIGVLEMTGRRFAILRQFDDVEPHPLVIHTTKRLLFFVLMDLGTNRFSATRIMKSDLDGGNSTPVVTYPNALIVQGITIDYDTDRLFFTDYSLASRSSAVFSCDLNGRDKREIFAIPGLGLWGIGVVNGYIYTANTRNSTPGEYFIHMRGRDGGEIKNLKVNLMPRFVAIYSPKEPHASSIPNECRNNLCEHICVASFNGSSSCKCSDGYTLVDGYKCEAAALDDNYLMVSDTAQLALLKVPVLPNTRDVEAVAHPMEAITQNRIYAFAIDQRNGDLIFYKEDLNDKRIVWGNKSIPFETDVNGIVAHCCEDMIYWITAENIFSWDGKSNEYTTFDYSFEFWINYGIVDITIDCITKHLYWTEYSSFLTKGSVKRSDLNGENVEIVLDNLPIAKGLTIDYESHTLHVAGFVSTTLYSVPLTQTRIRNTSIYFSNNSVTDFSIIQSVEENLGTIRDIRAIDGQIYLIGDQRIHRFRLGENPVSSVEGYGPNIFNRGTHVAFYNRTFFQRYIEPSSCAKPSEQTSTATVPQRSEECKSLLAKALASSDGYINALHVYIKCVIRSLLPGFLRGEQRDFSIGQLVLPRMQ